MDLLEGPGVIVMYVITLLIWFPATLLLCDRPWWDSKRLFRVQMDFEPAYLPSSAHLNPGYLKLKTMRILPQDTSMRSLDPPIT